jgi:hypothetical protein
MSMGKIFKVFGFRKKKGEDAIAIQTVSWGELGRPRIASHHEAQTVITRRIHFLWIDDVWRVTALVGLVDGFSAVSVERAFAAWSSGYDSQSGFEY